MSYQLLQGITISPRGNYNLGRFGKSMVDGGSWPSSFAFGGWIYNASCDIGFSNNPTEIKMNIVLEVTDRSQKYAFFDIGDKDLKCDAGEGDNENWFDIDFNGVNFTNLILYSYEISIENNAKILNVTFKDYSIILNKIYVGLLKRQGCDFRHDALATLSFPVLCPDCILAGDTIHQNSSTTRNITYGSYVGINGKTYDNYADIVSEGNIFSQWEKFFISSAKQPFFDLNGGYLIIGTEDATEERCGDLAPISYNFNQLLASLRMRGMKFEGAFPKAVRDADFIYRQNYIGSLREVLQQWCSDLGYDFYCQGKTFIGINLNRALDISKVVDIADPTTELGKEFALNKATAILSYKQSSSLDNTFKQSVITTSNRPRMSKTHSKSPKRYVGILPLHPIDFNRRNNENVIRRDAFGNLFYDIAWTNSFEKNSFDRIKTLPELDGRNFGDIDTSIALGRYNQTLRDIFCQDKALYGESLSIRAANFRALGMVPLVEITGVIEKAAIIEKASPQAEDEVENICRDQRFYKVFLGYYYQSFKEDVLRWEQDAAESMYKYGIVVKGLLNHFPYMPANQLIDISPLSGLYGEGGTSLLRISHTIEPDASQFYALRMAPFKDLILFSGLATRATSSISVGVFAPTGLFPTGLFYSSINNDWGTSQEVFNRKMSLYLDDPCIKEFGANNLNVTQMLNGVPNRTQDWRLDSFKPYQSPDIESFSYIISYIISQFGESPEIGDFDKTVHLYYDKHHLLQQQCSKLHLMVLTDTRNHPNIYLEFNPMGTSLVNPVMLQQYIDSLRESAKRRVQTKTPTVCDLTLLQEMCRNLLSGEWQAGPPDGDPRFGCIMDEDKWNWLEAGFTYNYLTRPNSRGLNIKIIKNPIRNNAQDSLALLSRGSDYNGDFYFSDLSSSLLNVAPAITNLNICYPISVNSVGGPDGMYYRGNLTSSVEVENRTPEMIDIYGTPVNTTFNGTTSLKIVNNPVDPDLQPQLDPYSMRFWSYMTVITGDSSIITTVQQYHEQVKRLNDYELTTPMKTVELSLAGSPNNFGDFKNYLSPNYGLNKMSISVSDNGVTTSLSFADRPKVLPKQESILNKISPRMLKK